MTRCRCIEGFEVQKVDENGFDTGECYFVEADSLWVLDEKTNYGSGQNHLECDDLLSECPSWIEISDEALERYVEVE